MRLSEIQTLLDATLYADADGEDREINTVFACDMMSDVLACGDEIEMMITGLVNQQVVRTADMMDIGVILFVRGKVPPEDVISMARQRDMIVLATDYRMFTTCGLLYEAGLRQEGN
jgi:predicted transcriptional regulator